MNAKFQLPCSSHFVFLNLFLSMGFGLVLEYIVINISACIACQKHCFVLIVPHLKPPLWCYAFFTGGAVYYSCLSVILHPGFSHHVCPDDLNSQMPDAAQLCDMKQADSHVASGLLAERQINTLVLLVYSWFLRKYIHGTRITIWTCIPFSLFSNILLSQEVCVAWYKISLLLYVVMLK